MMTPWHELLIGFVVGAVAGWSSHRFVLRYHYRRVRLPLPR